MNYNEAISYIGSRLRFGIKPGLERTRALLARLGDPQNRLRFVHVAGTNGKGSVCTMISEALCASDMRTGLFTSPYVTDFRERMQIGGVMIEKEALAELTARVAEVLGDDEAVTEFELITCIALLWFAESECETVVLETGLGGRFDSTNIIAPPLCSVITRIDLDHTAILGDTVERIAFEKAGIIKPTSPVVVYPDQPAGAMDVLSESAKRQNCRCVVPDTAALTVLRQGIDGSDIVYQGTPYHIGMPGAHQTINAVTAIETLRLLGIADQAIRTGLSRARVPARLEVLSKRPVVILDGAHNPNGAAALAEFIRNNLDSKRKLAVMGVCADKAFDRELELLAPLFDEIYCCDGFSDRALNADSLCADAAKITRATACVSPTAAIEMACSRAKAENCAMIVFGSLYLAGAVRNRLLELCQNDD